MMEGNVVHVILVRSRIVLLTVLFVLPGLPSVTADTIVLKSGRKVDVEMAWIEDGQVKGMLSGVEVTYPQSAVERIDQARREPAVDVDPRDGFRFAMWASGMRLAEARQLAETHAIELSAGRLPERNLSTAANTQPLTQAEAITFHYTENLLQRPAVVEIQFTPVSEELFALTIRWVGEDLSIESEFLKTIYSNLSQKYGRPDRKNTGFTSIEYGWNIQGHSRVNLETAEGIIEVQYLNNDLEQTAQLEVQTRSRAAEPASSRP